MKHSVRDYQFVEPVLLLSGGERVRKLSSAEAEQLVRLGSVLRPKGKRVRFLEIKAVARKVLPGWSLHGKFTYQERVLGGAARLTQHKGMKLSD